MLIRLTDRGKLSDLLLITFFGEKSIETKVVRTLLSYEKMTVTITCFFNLLSLATSKMLLLMGRFIKIFSDA